MFSGAILSLVGAAGSDQVGTGGLTTILAIASSGGVLGLVIQKWLNRNNDGAALSEKAMKLIRQSMDDVEVMRIEVARVSKRLFLVQQDLERANEQIADLEKRLATANGDRDALKAELAATVKARDSFQAQLSELQARMAGMEAAMEQGKKGEPGPTGSQGSQGSQGPSGPQGIQGEPGQDAS